jgi:CheY-like chemotaxis protein
MSPKTVIIAIDAADVRDRFAAALKGAGHRTIGVGRRAELLEALASPMLRVDLVVLDLGLGPAGAELVQGIREANATVPLIIFSGSVRSAAEVRTLADRGIVNYVNEHITTQRVLPALAPLLFPDSFDRRTSVRVNLNIPAALRSGDTIVAVQTLNLGKGGLAVRTMSPIEAGIRLRVRFRLPRSQHDIEAASRVVWSDSQSGLGLQFEEVETHDQSAIDEFIDQHAYQEAPPPSEPPSPFGAG